jgi:pimeloyl-ACP methyl ester carboxylesterase
VAPFLLAVCLAAFWNPSARAGKVTLKSGFEITGTPVKVPGLDGRTVGAQQGENVPQVPYWLVDDGMRRYFVHRLNLREGLDGVDPSDDTSGYARFTLKPLIRRRELVPTWIGRFAGSTEWDEFGHRIITLTTPRGPVDISVAITILDPRYIKIESTTHNWDFAIPPNAIPLPLLRQILAKSINPQNPVDRLAVVKFFLQSDQLAGARDELAAIRRDLPELEARVVELEQLIKDQYGNKALLEIEHRRGAGQHELARQVARRAVREDLSPATIRDAQAILDEYDAAVDKARHALGLLGMLQAELPAEEAQRLTPLRAMIERELTYATLPRLEPFLLAAEDQQLAPQAKLALAYSGWVLGPAQAKTQLAEAIALWDARFLVLQYLHPASDRADREQLLTQLKNLEGISVPVVAQMVPQLPPAVEFSQEPVGTVQSFEVPAGPGETIITRYSVVLPPEYNPARTYPAVVALRAEDRTVEDTLRFWAGTAEQPGAAQRNGYIVIAPDYASPERGDYDYAESAHVIVQRSLCDARRRLSIDSDRVFLSGHGMGGDAAVDLGLAHPDLWAGVIPFTAEIRHAAAFTFRNAPELPWYFVGGERDRDTIKTNATHLVLRMRRGDDVVYCEYKGRGFESYSEELPRIFDWMALYRRQRVDREIDQTVLRGFEDRLGWLKWTEPPATLTRPIAWDGGKAPRSMPVTARLYETGLGLNVRHPGRRTTLWLSPELVSYEQPVKIDVNGAAKFNDYVTPDVGALLDDLRDRGDRQMLYWTRLSF